MDPELWMRSIDIWDMTMTYSSCSSSAPSSIFVVSCPHILTVFSMKSQRLLRLYSKDIGSEGLRAQLIPCAPFLSIAQYFRMLYILYPKIQMAIITYPKVWTTII
jgi:hypothetical protein